MAGISFSLIFSSVITIEDLTSPEEENTERTHDLTVSMYAIGFFAFIAIIPFLLLPSTFVGAIILGILETIVLIRYGQVMQ